MSTFSFTPANVNATLGVSTVTGNVALTGTGTVLRIANMSTVEAFVALGASTVTVAAGGSKSSADDGGFSIPGATVTFMTLPPDATTIAGITASGTTTLRLNRGDGGV